MWLLGAILLAVFVLPDAWDLPVIVVGAVAEVGDGVLWMRWSRRRRAAVGAEALPGQIGVVAGRCDPVGWVKLGGELWKARALGLAPIDPGASVRVVALEGLTLVVERAD